LALSLAVGLSGCANAGGSDGGSGRLFGKKGAPWTVLCLEMSGPTRTRDIEQFAETLRNTPTIRSKEVVVRDEADGIARLYYGNYRWLPAKDGKPAPMPALMRNDLTMLRQLGDPAGRRYFLHAVPVRMPTPDVGNPDWALTRAKGVYTLQVAVFEPTDDFFEYKEAAAEYCKFLREKNYEAYYYHTNAASLVTVGAFGPEVVIRPPPEVAQHEYLKKGAIVLPVYSGVILALQRDELLKYNLHNGGIRYTRKPDNVRVPELSQLVEIPQPTPTPPIPPFSRVGPATP
jgi:hypothetical protein